MLRQLGFAAISLLPLSLAQVSNDFESGWDQTAWPTYAPDCNQGGSVSLDTSVAHSGSNSVKVNGAGGYCGHIFFGTTNVPDGDVYVRTWLRASKPLTSSHISFIVMPDSGLGAKKHLRIGGQSEILMYNRETDDATLPDLSPQGIASSESLPANTWQCFEYHLGPDGTIETWLNGDAIEGLTVGPGISNPNSNGWTRGGYKPSIDGVYFGWESYGGDANTFWYDDIAIASSRVGCSAAGGGSGGSPAPTTTAKPSTTTAKPSTTLSTSTKSSASVPAPTTSTKATSAAPSPSSCTAQKWGQCGGQGWTGCTVCAAGSTCKASGQYYSQCL